MSATVLPPDILTEPKENIFINGPFLKEQNMNIRLKNEGEKSIGWMVKSTNPQRFIIKPTCGYLKPQEETILGLKCQPFNYNRDLSGQDRVTVEWVEAPEKADHFTREWFHKSGVIRRHLFAIDYNL